MSRTAYNHIETTNIPWVESSSIRGSWRKHLLTDPKSNAFVDMSFTAPGFGPARGERLKKGPRRHFHRTVNERHYWLAGDYPAWRWKDPTDIDGELTIFHRHGYLENPPMSIHGIRPETVPQAGCELIVWATGLGTGVDEPEAAQETVHVPFDDVPRYNEAFRQPLLFSSEDLPWRPHPVQAGWKTKLISDGVENSPTASLNHVPADSSASHIRVPGDRLRWMFLLSGDLQVILTENGNAEQITLKENSFLSWQEGAELSYPSGPISSGGCVALCIGHDLARGVA